MSKTLLLLLLALAVACGPAPHPGPEPAPDSGVRGADGGHDAGLPDAGVDPSGVWLGDTDLQRFNVGSSTLLFDYAQSGRLTLQPDADGGFWARPSFDGCANSAVDAGFPVEMRTDGTLSVGHITCPATPCTASGGVTGTGQYVIDGGSGSWGPGGIHLTWQESYASTCAPTSTFDVYTFDGGR